MSSGNILSFIHISDIHFNKMSGDPYDIDKELRDAMLLDLHQNASTQLQAVNGILVCGDIAFSGQQEEYRNALDFLKEIMNMFSLENKDIFCVPGNHDVDQAVARKSYTLDIIQQNLAQNGDSIQLDRKIREIQKDSILNIPNGLLYQPIRTYNQIFSPMSCSFTIDNPNWSTYIPLNNTYNLVIYGMNSTLTSSYLDHLDDNKKRREDGTERKMTINRGQIPSVRSNAIYLSLCHHPPECWANSELQKYMDERVLIQLYGHKHIQDIDNNAKRVRISSGALQPDRGNDWVPRYNWLEIFIENDKLNVKIYPRIYDDNKGIFKSDQSSCDENCEYKLCRLEYGKKLGETEIPLEKEETTVKCTTIMTKDIVYRFSVLSDYKKKNLLRKFSDVKYEINQDIGVLLSEINRCNIETDFLKELRNMG